MKECSSVGPVQHTYPVAGGDTFILGGKIVQVDFIGYGNEGPQGE